MAEPSTVQRKLAAIVAADVAGYSRLMGAGRGGNSRSNKVHPRRGYWPEDSRATAGQDEVLITRPLGWAAPGVDRLAA
jgi:hypothetical protein